MPRLLACGLLLAFLPLAAAAAFDAPDGRQARVEAAPGTTAVASFPISVAEAGELYAKVIPTTGNALNDGSGANASWRARFALVREDGTREEIGPDRRAPVAAGESLAFEVALDVPADAGALSRAQVALAFRSPAQGEGSGATLDESRAFTVDIETGDAPPPVGEIATGDRVEDEVVEAPGEREGQGSSIVALVIGVGALAVLGAIGAVVLPRRKKGK